MRYLINQSLPEKYVSVIEKYGECIPLPPSKKIPLPTGAHPDAVAAEIDGEIFICLEDEALASALERAGIKYRLSTHAAGDKYPLDCALNTFTVRNALVCKKDSVSREVLTFAQEKGFEIANVRQGYAHCATAKVGGGAITADVGIYGALSHRGVPTLLIKEGGVVLPPYKYGFIGGASAYLECGVILFFGSLNFHPDGEKIRAFCKKMNVEVIEGDDPLFDYGGVITASGLSPRS